MMGESIYWDKCFFYKWRCLIVCLLFAITVYADDEWTNSKLKTKDGAVLTVSSHCLDYKKTNLERNPDEPLCTIVVDAIRDTKIVSSSQSKRHTDTNLAITSVVAPSLKGVVELLEVRSGEGNYIDSSYLAWTGKDILFFAELGGVDDSDHSAAKIAVFNDDPEFSDIVTIVKYGPVVDDVGGIDTIYEALAYQWNGVVLTLLDRDKP